MGKYRASAIGVLLFGWVMFVWPTGASASIDGELSAIYQSRPDLQAVFEPDTGLIRASAKARYDLADLVEWARQWGYREYPIRLADYRPTFDLASYRQALARIYWERTDLQKVFDANTWRVLDAAKQEHDLTDLEDWARQWGYREYPGVLFRDAPIGAIAASAQSEPASPTPPLSQETSQESSVVLIDDTPDPFYETSGALPQLKPGSQFPFSTVSANSLLVIDDRTHDILLARNTKTVWPIASITKLMNAMVVLDRQVPMDKVMTIIDSDKVGGVYLRVPANSQLSVRDLLFATLVSSANDAAMTLSRSTGMGKADFVAAMNAKAEEIGLRNTQFVDPTGIELGNVSTARDVAKMLTYALDNYWAIRMVTTTAKHEIDTIGGFHHEIETTNQLLADENNGLYVMGGKTGYLNESQWNLAFRVKDWHGRPVTAVLFGSDYKNWVFSEADQAVRWAWNNYIWP